MKYYYSTKNILCRHFPKEIYGVTEDSSARLYLRSKYGYKSEENPLELTIYFSALKWGEKINLNEDFITYNKNKIEICFSTHCGRDELLFFINYFKPKKIVGFPQDFYVDDNFLDCNTEMNEDRVKVEPKKRKKDLKEYESVTVGKRVNKSDIEDAFNW